MAKLSDAVKRRIVQGHAWYETTAEIIAAVKEAHGLTLSTPQVAYYNPAAPYSELAAKWRDLFDEERERFRRDTSQIAIASKAFRLRKLERMARAAEERKNFALAAQLLEQAAKECGGAYRNARLPQSAPSNLPELRVRRETKSAAINAPEDAA
jgi:hypothetical protein